jgi:hypothetical protein
MLQNNAEEIRLLLHKYESYYKVIKYDNIIYLTGAPQQASTRLVATRHTEGS